MKNRFKNAFTMLELIIVIVIMGIAAKFGSELLMKAYEDYIYGVSNNRLLGQSEAAVTQIANRLQYRIKESIIFRQGDHNGTFINTFTALASVNSPMDKNTTVVEWVGYDIDGWHGDGSNTLPTWSGIIDLDHAGASGTAVYSPESNSSRISGAINALSPRFQATGTAPTPALFFIGDESVNVHDGFAWDGNPLTDQTKNLHPVTLGNGLFQPLNVANGHNFTGVDVYEYYRLAWSAYALELHTWVENPAESADKQIAHGTLWLYYDYQPWLGENYTNGKKVVLMENVQTLRFNSIGDVLKVQVCVGDGNIFKKGAYSVCKEKTIF